MRSLRSSGSVGGGESRPAREPGGPFPEAARLAAGRFQGDEQARLRAGEDPVSTST